MLNSGGTESGDMQHAGLAEARADGNVTRLFGRLAPSAVRAAMLFVMFLPLLPTTGSLGSPRGASGRQPPPATQSFHDAVALAWERLPQRRMFAARQATSAARYAAGGALVPNAPSAKGSYINDKVAGSNNNYVTTQVELSTPVWLPAEGTATQTLARSDAVADAAAAEAAHLALAAQVLDLATQATLAANARDVAARRLATDQALATDLARRFRTGESSQSDSLAADADAAGAIVSMQAAQAQFDAARVALAAVTGTDLVPRLDALGDAPAGANGGPSANPRVVAAEQAVAAAKANVRLVRIADRDDPEIGVEGVNEKQPGTRWDTRFGITAHFFFATEARNAPRRAEAEQALTQAEVQLALVQREVTTAIKQAEAILSGAERGNAAAIRAAAELEKRRGQIERAWRLGEVALIEVVRANALAFDAAYARDKTRTDLDAARLRLRLASGGLP